MPLIFLIKYVSGSQFRGLTGFFVGFIASTQHITLLSNDSDDYVA
jgi:hypothetical protein